MIIIMFSKFSESTLQSMAHLDLRYSFSWVHELAMI
jgi:hypothetical protein